MKRLTSIGLMIAAFSVGLVLSPHVQAKGSSAPQGAEQSGSGMIQWSDAQRVMSWGPERHWQNTSGQILICPWDAKASNDKECRDKKNDKIDRWIPLTSYEIPGFQIAGFQYFYSGSYSSHQLVVYYGAPKPKLVVGVVNDADADAVKRSLNLSGMSATVGTITINANRVIVQRKKQ